jgi:hypothetical protein
MALLVSVWRQDATTSQAIGKLDNWTTSSLGMGEQPCSFTVSDRTRRIGGQRLRRTHSDSGGCVAPLIPTFTKGPSASPNCGPKFVQKPSFSGP